MFSKAYRPTARSSPEPLGPKTQPKPGLKGDLPSIGGQFSLLLLESQLLIRACDFHGPRLACGFSGSLVGLRVKSLEFRVCGLRKR